MRPIKQEDFEPHLPPDDTFLIWILTIIGVFAAVIVGVNLHRAKLSHNHEASTQSQASPQAGSEARIPEANPPPYAKILAAPPRYGNPAIPPRESVEPEAPWEGDSWDGVVGLRSRASHLRGAGPHRDR